MSIVVYLQLLIIWLLGNPILTIVATMLLFEILCEILTKAFFIPFGAAHSHPKEGWVAEMGIKNIPFGVLSFK
ncbi:MAG: hypothetical protein MRK02_16300 [Candidatus Scalindua sp.]|nr:hypothetical protein [Candidatus Scalindua sp.]